MVMQNTPDSLHEFNATHFTPGHSNSAHAAGRPTHPLNAFPWLFSRLSHSTIFQRQRRAALSKVSINESNDCLNSNASALPVLQASATPSEEQLQANTKALVLASKVLKAFLHAEESARETSLQQLANAAIDPPNLFACMSSILERYTDRCEDAGAKIIQLWDALTAHATKLNSAYFTASFSALEKGHDWKDSVQTAAVDLPNSQLTESVHLINLFKTAIAVLEGKRGVVTRIAHGASDTTIVVTRQKCFARLAELASICSMRGNTPDGLSCRKVSHYVSQIKACLKIVKRKNPDMELTHFDKLESGVQSIMKGMRAWQAQAADAPIDHQQLSHQELRTLMQAAPLLEKFGLKWSREKVIHEVWRIEDKKRLAETLHPIRPRHFHVGPLSELRSRLKGQSRKWRH